VDLTVGVLPDLAGVNPAEWDRLDHGPSPFTEHGFLRALECSGSVGGRSGWQPRYVVAHGSAAGRPRLLGAVAAYVKQHSYGEYIFDWGWAQAAQRAGIAYYPKLVVAVPATPATGRRLLLDPELSSARRAEVAAALVVAVRALADEEGCSGVHWLFCTAEEEQLLCGHGYCRRASFQFHWRNGGYASFDAFLAGLSSRKRKQLRRERRLARASVDDLRLVDGRELSAVQLAAIDRFYRTTVRAHGGRAYLRPGFFEEAQRRLGHRMQFSEAVRGGSIVAGALFFETGQALYGRYWGSEEQLPFVHFEAAYYAGIERCIARKIPLFEAGAQGEHKLLRGFAPAATHSAHWLRHPRLFDAVRAHLQGERDLVDRHVEQLREYLPFRRDPEFPP
jgi:hypothetical protein